MGVYTSINDPSVYFQTAIYNGNGGANTITNDGNSNLQPDWLWFKERSSSSYHHVFDTSRGVGGSGKALYTNNTDAEAADTALTSVNTDGFTLANTGGFNENGQTNVCWQWKANGGTTASNSNGTITSTVQANTTAGFSIVTYTGTGSAATLGHGLGSAPEVVIVKSRSQGYGWIVYHKAAASDAHTDYLGLDDSDALTDFPMWNDTAPTSTVFSVGTDVAVNNNTQNYVAYCFAEKQGYSKFGSYEGNGNANGTFVYTGFKPAWFLCKQTNTSRSWTLIDSKRPEINSNDTKALVPNESGAEENIDADFLSNGLKIRQNQTAINESGGSYIYMAFAESPFVSSAGVPVTAR
jgi:hypothetical protein